ncbi:MAG: 1-acyl-sn-glycerol-3-phosphate acyltransferase [Simkania negevensis]|nr:1-acyl-sn-glycerol-3-phosphate acyltransferase [Simkania negevensis]
MIKRQMKRLLYWTAVYSLFCIFKLLYRFKVYGRSHYLQGGGIIAANHVSFYDPPIIAVSCREEVHFLARRSLFKSFFGVFLRIVNVHPVEASSSNLEAMRAVSQILQESKKVVLFPEGTRGIDGDIGEIKPGISLFLAKSKTAIIPTYIHGSLEVWGRHRKLPRLWGTISVVFGSPILWSDFASMEKREGQLAIAEQLKFSLQNLKRWVEKGAKGAPP